MNRKLVLVVVFFAIFVFIITTMGAGNSVREINKEPQLVKDRPSDKTATERSVVMRAYTCFACHAPFDGKGNGVIAEKMNLLRFLTEIYSDRSVSEEYNNDKWKMEMAITLDVGCEKHSIGSYSLEFMFGSCSLPCQNCGTIGFYSPRQVFEGDKITRKYRACKFCGLWQETEGDLYNRIGGKPWRCKMIHCEKCGVYDWRYPLLTDFGKCVKCGSPELKEVAWPSDDPNHIFHMARRLVSRAHNAHMREQLEKMRK